MPRPHNAEREEICTATGNIIRKNPGKRPGRRTIFWLKNLRTLFCKTTTGLFSAVLNKIMLARMIANIRNGQAPEEEEPSHTTVQDK